MIVHVLKKQVVKKVSLPEKVFGVYPLLNDTNKILANIEAKDGKWYLMKNSDIEILSNGESVSEVQLVDFGIYVIKDLFSGELIKLVSSPTYDTSMKYYSCKKNQITIGSDPSSSIRFNLSTIKPTHITLTKKDNYWVATTEENETYISGRPFRKKNMFHGEYIFLYGLKVIVINDYFIINNARNAVTVSPESFDSKVIEQQSVTYDKNISDDTPLYSKLDYFFKAPRFKSVIEVATLKIDPPPPKNENEQNPMILQIGPRLTMMVTTMYSLVSTLTSFANGETSVERIVPLILTTIAMLLTTFLWPTITRRYNKKRERRNEIKRQRKYKKYLEKKSQKLKEIKALQKQILIENNIPLEECQSIIYNRKRNLWERNIENDDFLSLRLGTGQVECKIEIDDPSDQFTIEDEDNLMESLNELLKEGKYIEDCPMSVSLVEKRNIAVVGNSLITKYFMDNLLLQIITFHSYTDLKIITFTSENNEYLWEYLKVLPHSWDNQKEKRYFATTLEEMSEISSILEKPFQERKEKDEESKIEDNGITEEQSKPYTKYRPYYLIIIDDLESARNIGIVRKVLAYKVNLGFSIIIRNNRLSNLPSEISTFINVDENNSGLFESDLISNNQKQFKPELNKTIDMYGCAQRLANIPIVKEKAKYELPNSISFLSMYKVGKVEQLNSLDRWKTNNPVNSLSVPVGINQDGELFKMDIHEKAYGPHGLVAGMTGSGKSEWIITYILSLAVNFHPDEVQFVLIDYKGGGLALSFENQEMGIKLPHLAGTITNLDKSAINRAITSIEAELKRRQKKFNEAREKLHESSINIYKYQQYYRKGMLDEPMSHLFIISDEFAELKSQEPEFLNQLVSTARIGRSLGVHLILATQKPSGVVSDQIWSNSRFKVCLRVQDKGDSQEMIKCPDAAMLKNVGAFYLQVGYNEVFTLGQSAWAGAKYYPSDIVKADIDQSIQYIDNMGQTINSFDENSFKPTEQVESKGEELLNIVSYLTDISKQEPYVGKQLWLPNIPAKIMLSEIKKKYNHKPLAFSLQTIIGEYDNPALQKQDVLKIDLSENTVIYGEGGSGKENLLSTIIWSNITEHTPQEVNYYIIDFGAETLRMFAKFPHVGEIAYQDSVDVVAGILDMVNDEIEKRKELFADYNGNYTSYLQESGKQLPRWVVVINYWDVFQDNLGRIIDIVTNMFRDAVKYGITFIVTTTSHQSFRAKISAFFKNKLVLHQPDDANYRTILNCPRGLVPANSPSRGICQIDDGTFCEFQGAYITEPSKINMLVRQNAQNFANSFKTRAKSLPKIPDNVTSEELAPYITDLENVPIGYNFHEKNVIKFNAMREKMFAICADSIKNSMSSIYGLINIFSKIPGCKVRVIDFDNIYEGSNLDIKLFNSSFDATVIALEKDLETRTMTQDHGITFILGAGVMKNKLQNIGKEHLNNYLSIITKANKSTIILVDTYERMKKLKIEPWFASLNTSYGLWLGPNIMNQNLFSVREITMEERKLNYEGMGFIIEGSEYTMIKTVLDGDD